jgi:hypothetical protein
MDMSVSTGLDIYLKDHLAGATAGNELARKLSAEYSDGPLGNSLAEIVREIEHDKDELEKLMAALDVAPDSLKQAGAWVAEKLSRLKLSDTFNNDPDLKRMLSFEVLALGIEGKAEMWRALMTIADAEPEIAKLDLDDLVRRADEQRATMEKHRLEAARDAFSS